MQDLVARFDSPRQGGAEALEEGVAGRQHADLAAAMAQNLIGRAVKRARPGPRGATNKRRSQAKMPFAAEHDLRRADQAARARA